MIAISGVCRLRTNSNHLFNQYPAFTKEPIRYLPLPGSCGTAHVINQILLLVVNLVGHQQGRRWCGSGHLKCPPHTRGVGGDVHELMHHALTTASSATPSIHLDRPCRSHLRTLGPELWLQKSAECQHAF